MSSGAATGVQRAAPLFWAVALGSLSYSALVTLAIQSRTDVVTPGAGMKIGAIVGFLLWFTADFMLYGISQIGSLTSTLLAPLIELIPGAIAGAVITRVLGNVPHPHHHASRIHHESGLV